MFEELQILYTTVFKYINYEGENMTGAIIKNKIFLIILALLVIVGVLIICINFQRKNEIPSKGVFVIEGPQNLEIS